MDSNWAAEHLQVIRTLMERSALYRRALAPIMIFTGVVGIAGGCLGWALKIESSQGFIAFWAGAGIVALAGSFLLVRRQALRESEPFWSPPTRRVTQALLPGLVAGFIAGAVVFAISPSAQQDPGSQVRVLGLLWLPLCWVVLYGCAVH